MLDTPHTQLTFALDNFNPFREVYGFVAADEVFAFVGDLVPVAQRQVAMGRILFALMTGNLLGALAAGAVADLFGWRAVFFVMSGLGLIVFAIVFYSHEWLFGVPQV